MKNESRKSVILMTLAATIALVALIILGLSDASANWTVNLGAAISNTFPRLGEVFNFANWTNLTTMELIAEYLAFNIIGVTIVVTISWIILVFIKKRFIYLPGAFINLLVGAIFASYVVNIIPVHGALIDASNILSLFLLAVLVIAFVFDVALLVLTAIDTFQPYGVIVHAKEDEVIRTIVLTTDDHIDTPVIVTKTVVVLKESRDYVEDDTSMVIVKEKSTKESPKKIEETPIEYVDDIPSEVVSDPLTLGDGGFGKKKPRPPFALRLRRGEDHIRSLYNEIKAEFLSYGLNSRISLNGDSFRLHAKTYAVIQVVGKSLKINFALATKDYIDSPIPFTDSGKQKRYEEIPFTFKVRSGLSVKRAKELIKDAAAKDGITQENEPIEKNYSRETIETLRTSQYYLNNFARKKTN